MRVLILLILTEVLLLDLAYTSRVRVRRQNMKVRITATGDTIVLKFLRPEVDTKLQGFILGYGSGMFSKQFIKLPEDSEHYETEIDAEPKYLIVVRPVKANEERKKCMGKMSLEKPLHLMIGTVTPTSVLLSWGTLLQTPYADTDLDDCIEDGEFTVRYKEKETGHKWNYETCPTTDTVIDNLKPNTPYEFEIRAETGTNTGAWSPPVLHNTADTNIHEPLKPSHLGPQKPIVESPRAFFRPVTALHNTNQSRQPPVLKHASSPIPIPRRNQGTGSDGIASSSPSEDPFFFSQTRTFNHILLRQATSKTTNPCHPQPSTSPPLSNTTQQQLDTLNIQVSTLETQSSKPYTQLRATKAQSITTETQPVITNAQTSTTETHTSAIRAPLHTINRKTAKFYSTGQLQSNTIQPQSRTPQSQTSQKDPIIAQAKPIKSKTLPSTTQQFPSTSQQQETQFKSTATQAKPTIFPKTRTTQTQTIQQIFSTALPTNIVQQQIPTQPSNIYEKVSLTLPQMKTTRKQPNKIHHPSLSRSNQHQTYTVMPKSIQHKQVSSTNVSPAASTPKVDTIESTASQHPIFQHTPYKAKETPSKTNDWHIPSTLETVIKTREQPLSSNKFQKKPALAQDHHTPSSTIQTPHTTQWQYGKTDSTPKSKPQIINVLDTGTKHVAEQSSAKIQTNLNNPPAKSNVIHWPETQAVNEKLSGSQEAPSQSQDGEPLPKPALVSEVVDRDQGQIIFRNSSAPVLVARPPGPKVVQNRTRPVSNSYNSSSAGLVRRPLGPTIVRNEAQPIKMDSRNFSSPVLVRRPPTPKVVRPWDQMMVRNKTRPEKTDSRSSPGLPSRPLSPTVVRNRTPHGRGPPGALSNLQKHPTLKVPSDVKHQGPKPSRPRKPLGSPVNIRGTIPNKKTPNQVKKSTEKGDKITDLKQAVDRLPVLKPQVAPSTEKNIYRKSTTTTAPLWAFNGSRLGVGPDSSVFSSIPLSDVDAVGKKRFVGPHVLYKTDKRPEEPCSVTHSLSFFPDEENEEINVTGPPKTPPSNVTVVTVEGCPSFVIVDWDKTDNETTEYEVSTKGPNGKEIAVVTTNQTHTAVENLKPQSNYEFTVTPKNELGAGPAAEPVTFSTESADPRVSDIPTGKTAIWSSFPFKADSYSECNGRQFVKRTWYRKFVGIQLCNSLRYKIYLSDSLKGRFYTIGDQTGYGEDHCQFVDSYLDGRTGPQATNQLPLREGYFRSMRQEPVRFGKIGGNSHINYVAWYECGVPIPGSW